MTFDRALRKLRAGCKLGRSEWGTKRWLQFETLRYKKVPNLVVHFTRNPAEVSLWTPQQSDLLAGDWFEITC